MTSLRLPGLTQTVYEPSSDNINEGLSVWWLTIPGRKGWSSNQWHNTTEKKIENGTLINMDSTNWLGLAPSPGFGSLDFNGTDEYIDIVIADTAIRTDTAFTVSATFWIDSFGASRLGLAQLDYADTVQNFQLEVTDITNYQPICFGSRSNQYRENSTNNLTLNQWHHVIVTYTGAGIGTIGNWALYRNGVSVTLTTASNLSSNTAALSTIGSSESGLYFNGKIADFRIYRNRRLTAAECFRLYREAMTGYPKLLKRTEPSWFRDPPPVTLKPFYFHHRRRMA